MSSSVPEMGGVYATEVGVGGVGHPSLRLYLWWALCTLCSLTCQVELLYVVLVSVVVSLSVRHYHFLFLILTRE